MPCLGSGGRELSASRRDGHGRAGLCDLRFHHLAAHAIGIRAIRFVHANSVRAVRARAKHSHATVAHAIVAGAIRLRLCSDKSAPAFHK